MGTVWSPGGHWMLVSSARTNRGNGMVVVVLVDDDDAGCCGVLLLHIIPVRFEKDDIDMEPIVALYHPSSNIAIRRRSAASRQKLKMVKTTMITATAYIEVLLFCGGSSLLVFFTIAIVYSYCNRKDWDWVCSYIHVMYLQYYCKPMVK